MPKPAKGDTLGAVTAKGTPPILVIGTTGDPATPYAGAQAMVGRIAGSQLLRAAIDEQERGPTLIDDLNALPSAPAPGAKPPTVREEAAADRIRDAAET